MAFNAGAGAGAGQEADPELQRFLEVESHKARWVAVCLPEVARVHVHAYMCMCDRILVCVGSFLSKETHRLRITCIVSRSPLENCLPPF